MSSGISAPMTAGNGRCADTRHAGKFQATKTASYPWRRSAVFPAGIEGFQTNTRKSNISSLHFFSAWNRILKIYSKKLPGEPSSMELSWVMVLDMSLICPWSFQKLSKLDPPAIHELSCHSMVNHFSIHSWICLWWRKFGRFQQWPFWRSKLAFVTLVVTWILRPQSLPLLLAPEKSTNFLMEDMTRIKQKKHLDKDTGL